jgi:hypothetical protein
MRLRSIAAWSTAAVLLAGTAMADPRAGTPIALDWSSLDMPAGTSAGAPGDAALSDLAPDLQARFPGYDLQAGPSFAGLVPPEPPASLGRQLFESERFAGATLALAGDLHLHLGAAASRPADSGLPLVSNLEQLQLSRAAALDGSRTILAGADWDVASWGGLGIAAAQFTQPDGGWAGLTGPQFATPRVSTLFGVSAHLNFGDGWITSFSYDEGRTQYDLRPDALSITNDDTASRIFDFTVTKSDVFGGDALGLSWVRPAQPSDSVLLAPQISLSSSTPESDFQLDYETSFNGNVTLQANAGYQMNVNGQNGTKAISVLSRAKINF